MNSIATQVKREALYKKAQTVPTHVIYMSITWVTIEFIPKQCAVT